MKLREALAALEFVAAKMMAHVPHEYTVRSGDNAQAFDTLRAAIREHGITEDW